MSDPANAPRNSGLADSGLVDSGPVDSGPVDSGPVDSGPVDGGPVDRGPAVSFPPPLLFVSGFAIGVVISRFWPIPAPWPTGVARIVVGLLMFGVGVTLALVGVITFRSANVAVYPNRPARQLVTHGIYQYTRNPMYVGMTVAYLGGVIVTGMVWALFTLPIVLIVLYLLVIRREERHLVERFPSQFAEYCGKVRRWI